MENLFEVNLGLHVTSKPVLARQTSLQCCCECTQSGRNKTLNHREQTVQPVCDWVRRANRLIFSFFFCRAVLFYYTIKYQPRVGMTAICHWPEPLQLQQGGAIETWPVINLRCFLCGKWCITMNETSFMSMFSESFNRLLLDFRFDT